MRTYEILESALDVEVEGVGDDLAVFADVVEDDAGRRSHGRRRLEAQLVRRLAADLQRRGAQRKFHQFLRFGHMQHAYWLSTVG